MSIEKFLPKIKRNILLKNYTTFRIGGPAKYFFEAKNKEDLIKAIQVSKKIKLPFFILGGGSNLLVSDEGFEGLVIKTFNTKYKIFNTKIFAEAGLPLNKLVSISVDEELRGLEWGMGIPGTVGGAIRGNAGAFGKSMADIVKNVEILKITGVQPLQIRKLKNKDCNFKYRDSIFKYKKNLIILSTELQFQKGDKKKIKEKMKEFLDYRKKTQPLGFPSAGSIFKNPPDISAGQFIDKCGLRGKKFGNVKISEKHANFIVNLGGGEAKDVIKLIKLIKKEVKNKFDIKLEEEIQYLGF